MSELIKSEKNIYNYLLLKTDPAEENGRQAFSLIAFLLLFLHRLYLHYL